MSIPSVPERTLLKCSQLQQPLQDWPADKE